MEDRMMKFYSKESNMLALHAMHGHFATSHSHINYYVDVTSIKTRVAEAKQAAHVLYSRIPKTKYVDTIVCMDGNRSCWYVFDRRNPKRWNYGNDQPA